MLTLRTVTSNRRLLSAAELIATGIPFMGHGDFVQWTRIFGAVAPQVAGIRRLGAAALDLAWVAAGRFDAYWESDLKLWDVAAGIADRFTVIVDGLVAAWLGLPGKPAPDTFAYAADQLGATRQRAVVFEDALSGVRAGAAGGFGLVVGVDRGTGADRLREAGAGVVVQELDELI